MTSIQRQLHNVTGAVKKGFAGVRGIFARTGRSIHRWMNEFREGDLFVKLSLLVMGVGCLRRKQWTKGILMIAFQSAFVFFLIAVAIPNLAKLPTLGTVEYAQVWNPVTRQNEVNAYDHSLMILLYSLVSIMVILGYLAIHVNNVSVQRNLQIAAASGKRLPTLREDMKSLFDTRFHTTLLALPVLGVIVLTVIPLLFMILVAFTNYDQFHMPPIKLFTWVGWRNFITLFQTGSTSVTFGYAFQEVVTWTLIWAFFATFLTYIGGILLALLINNRFTKWKKMWRTVFVVTIAVPQFVSLLLVRNFFATYGIVNTTMASWGVTDWLKSMGLIADNLSYIPFLTDEVWSKVMLILINCWIGFPYVMLITTGVLMNIPKDLYESARIDGANRFQIFRKITMPYMLFVTAPYLITSFIHNMNNFNVIYLLTANRVTSDQLLANANASDTDLLITWLFKLTQDYYNYKMASVIGIVIFVLTAIATLIAFNYTIKSDKENRFQA